MVPTVLAVTADAIRIVAGASGSDEASANPWFGILFILVPLAIVAAWLFWRRTSTERRPRTKDVPPAETTEFLDDVNRPPGR